MPRMRGIAELYAALLLLAVGAAVVVAMYPWIEAHFPKLEPPRPVRVLEVNSSYVVCYVPPGVYVNLTYWRIVGSFSCWLVPNITSSTLQPCPSILEPGTYILVSPPWLCKP